MKKVFITSLLLVIGLTVLWAQKNKVEVTYNEPETYVVFNENLIGICPDFLKLDFAIGGDLVFFKPHAGPGLIRWV